MMAWLLVLVIICSTTLGDLLQSAEMKRYGRVDASGSGVFDSTMALARRPLLALSIVCMATSFFAFMVLLSVADLSFAVPATAGSLVIETVLASLILKERVSGQRWAGALLVAGGVALLAG